MKKNETKLTIRRAQVTTAVSGRLQARNEHGADLAYCQQLWQPSFPSAHCRKPMA